MPKSLRKGRLVLKPVLNPEGDIVTYDIKFPNLDENNTNLTVPELEFIEEVREDLKDLEVGSYSKDEEKGKGII